MRKFVAAVIILSVSLIGVGVVGEAGATAIPRNCHVKTVTDTFGNRMTLFKCD